MKAANDGFGWIFGVLPTGDFAADFMVGLQDFDFGLAFVGGRNPDVLVD